MFDSEPEESRAWQPDGWDLPVSEDIPGDDRYIGDIDPAFLRPPQEILGVEEGDAIFESVVADVELAPETSGEAVRDAVLSEALKDIKVCIDRAVSGEKHSGGFFNFTRESITVQDMIRQAVLDNDSQALATHIAAIQNLPHISYSALVEANLAGAAMGSTSAAEIVHEALDAERTGTALEQESARLEHTDTTGLYKAPHTPLHAAVIQRCVDYDVPAEHWINTYAIDDEDRWAKTAQYLLLRIDAAGPDADTAALQQAYDDHAATINGLPPRFTVARVADVLEHTTEPAAREQLFATFLAAVDDVPLSFERYKNTMKIAAQAADDIVIGTPYLVNAFKRYGDEGPKLFKDHPYIDVINAMQPYREAVMHRIGCNPHTFIEDIDKLTKAIMESRSSDRQHLSTMAFRDNYLASSAKRFAEAGDFEGAQQLLSNMSAEYEQRSARAECFALAGTADELEALKLDPLALIANPELGIHYEIAALRIAGDTNELITRAVGHARTIRPFDGMTPPISKDGLSDTAHYEYVRAAQAALMRVDPSQLPAFAKQILPIFRSLHRPFNSAGTLPLAEALIASGDTEEPVQALAYIQGFDGPRDMRVESLWALAKMLRRANEAG